MLAWEKNKQEQTNMNRSGTTVGIHKMRTFDQSNKSKKALKKEAKKKAQGEESEESNENVADGPEPASPSIDQVAAAR